MFPVDCDDGNSGRTIGEARKGRLNCGRRYLLRDDAIKAPLGLLREDYKPAIEKAGLTPRRADSEYSVPEK